jgi:hypothetical protein
MARKIITNNDSAWELTGVAKRLSFAVANMNLPIANLVVNPPGGGRVSVFRHGDMEIWDLRSGGGKTYFRIKIFRDDNPTVPISADFGLTGTARRVQRIAVYSKDTSSGISGGSWLGNGPVVNASFDQSYYKYASDGGTQGTSIVYNDGRWIFDSDMWSGWLTKRPPNKVPYVENGVVSPGEVYNGSSYTKDPYKDGYYVNVQVLDSIDTWYKTSTAGTSGELRRTTVAPFAGTYGTSREAEMVVKQPQDITIHVPYWKVGEITYENNGTSGTAPPTGQWGKTDVTCKINVKSSLPYQVNQVGFSAHTTSGDHYIGTRGTSQVCAPGYFWAVATPSTPPEWGGTVVITSQNVNLVLTYSDGQTQNITSFETLVLQGSWGMGWSYNGTLRVNSFDLSSSLGIITGEDNYLKVGQITGSISISGLDDSVTPPTPVYHTFTGFTIYPNEPFFAWIDEPIIL